MTRAMDKTRTYLTTQDPYGIYGPGDKIWGTANLFSVEPLLIRGVKVICSAVCRVFTFDQQRKPVKSALQVLFTKSMMVYDGKKQNSSHALTPGIHKWNYSCTLPPSNQLPPSFDYRDQEGTAEVMYVVVMRIDGDGLTSDQSRCYLKFKYAPRRSLSLASEEPLLRLSELLLIKRAKDTHGWKKGVPDAIRRRVFKWDNKHHYFRITMLLPHCAAFSEHMDISVKVESISNDQDPNSAIEFDLTLSEVEYQLWASTRVAFDKTSRFKQHLVQQESIHSISSLSANEHWISLRRKAPFRVQPRLYGMPFDKTSFSTIGPSFGTQNVMREYKLNIILFIVAWGETHRVSFEDNEVIVLPHETQAAVE